MMDKTPGNVCIIQGRVCKITNKAPLLYKCLDEPTNPIIGFDKDFEPIRAPQLARVEASCPK